MRTVVLAIVCSTLAVPLAAGEPPRLTRAGVSPAPWGVQSGGLVACGVTLDASGAVGSVDVVQDVAPYGARLRDDIVSSWRFEPGREDGRPVGTQVLVLAFTSAISTNYSILDNLRTVIETRLSADEREHIAWKTANQLYKLGLKG